MEYTVVEYMYRDASNYKAHGRIALKGKMTEEQDKTLRSYLVEGEFFIPDQVGLKPLQGILKAYDEDPKDDNPDDHDFHTIEEITPATDKEIEDITLYGTVEELLEAFRKAKENNWPITKSLNKITVIDLRKKRESSS